MIRRLELLITILEQRVYLWLVQRCINKLEQRKHRLVRAYHSGKFTDPSSVSAIANAMSDIIGELEQLGYKTADIKRNIEWYSAMRVIA